MLSSLRLIAKPSLGASSFLRPVAVAAASYSTGGKTVFSSFFSLLLCPPATSRLTDLFFFFIYFTSLFVSSPSVMRSI